MLINLEKLSTDLSLDPRVITRGLSAIVISKMKLRRKKKITKTNFFLSNSSRKTCEKYLDE